MGRFIVIEGLDGVGKSSVVARLAARMGAVSLATPGADVDLARRQVDESWSASPEARQLFYAASVLAASARVRALLADGHDVVVDRYWCSTLAYDRALRGTGLDLDTIEERLLCPDVTILLTAPLEVRMRRLGGRARWSGEDHFTLEAPIDRQLRAAFDDLLSSGRVVGVPLRADTSGLNEAQVADGLFEALEGLHRLDTTRDRAHHQCHCRAAL